MLEVHYNDKLKKKKEKLEKDFDKSKTLIEEARKENQDHMNKSWEDLELWKQKELAKGKDPSKVEKKYNRGAKILERIDNRLNRSLDKAETRVEDWDFNGRSRLVKAAHKKMINKVATSSIAKMERILTEDPNSDLKYIIAAYSSLVKKEKVSQLKHPRVYNEILNWERAIKEASKDDEYFKIFISLVDSNNQKDRKLTFKIETARIVNEIIEEQNISIRFLSEYTNIKYANLYNFLKKEIYTELSFHRTHLLLWATKNFSNGWTKEEALQKHIEKMKTVTEYWDHDLIGDK